MHAYHQKTKRIASNEFWMATMKVKLSPHVEIKQLKKKVKVMRMFK